jgi:hypothetical protein
MTEMKLQSITKNRLEKKTCYYPAIRHNGIGFEGKWMQLEDIVLSEGSQAQKRKGHVISVMRGR